MTRGGAAVEADEPVPRRRVAVERRSWALAGLGPGLVLGLLAGAGVILSLFLPWREPSVDAGDVPIAFLVDEATRDAEPSLLWLLVPLAALLVIGALLPRGALLRLLGGIGALAVAGLFAYQLDRLVAVTPGTDVVDALEPGFYVVAIGGILGVVSAFVPGAWTRRRTVESTDDPDADLWDRHRRRRRR